MARTAVPGGGGEDTFTWIGHVLAIWQYSFFRSGEYWGEGRGRAEAAAPAPGPRPSLGRAPHCPAQQDPSPGPLSATHAPTQPTRAAAPSPRAGPSASCAGPPCGAGATTPISGRRRPRPGKREGAAREPGLPGPPLAVPGVNPKPPDCSGLRWGLRRGASGLEAGGNAFLTFVQGVCDLQVGHVPLGSWDTETGGCVAKCCDLVWATRVWRGV